MGRGRDEGEFSIPAPRGHIVATAAHVPVGGGDVTEPKIRLHQKGKRISS